MTSPSALVRHPQPKRPLNRTQLTFNRLVTKVELARARLERDTRRFDAALAFHEQHLSPRLHTLAALRKDVVRAFAPFLTDRRVKQKVDRQVLRTILADQLHNIAAEAGALVDDDLRTLFEEIHGVSIEEADARHREDAQSDVQAVCDDVGVTVDLSGEPPPRRRKKTKRQLKEEERASRVEALRKRSLVTIYRQLAKVLHPDLEQDTDRRARKSALMQELTAAYRHQDLHTLLRLEVEWIRREETDVARLTEETLGLYNQILKEQADQLERAVVELPYDPRYQPLVTPTAAFGSRLQLDGAAAMRRLDRLILSFEESLNRLRSEDPLQEVRGVIQAFRFATREG